MTITIGNNWRKLTGWIIFTLAALALILALVNVAYVAIGSVIVSNNKSQYLKQNSFEKISLADYMKACGNNCKIKGKIINTDKPYGWKQAMDGAYVNNKGEVITENALSTKFTSERLQTSKDFMVPLLILACFIAFPLGLLSDALMNYKK